MESSIVAWHASGRNLSAGKRINYVLAATHERKFLHHDSRVRRERTVCCLVCDGRGDLAGSAHDLFRTLQGMEDWRILCGILRHDRAKNLPHEACGDRSRYLGGTSPATNGNKEGTSPDRTTPGKAGSRNAEYSGGKNQLRHEGTDAGYGTPDSRRQQGGGTRTASR